MDTEYLLLYGKVFIWSGKASERPGEAKKVSVEIAIARKSKNFQRGKTSSTSPRNQVKLKSVKSLNKQQASDRYVAMGKSLTRCMKC